MTEREAARTPREHEPSEPGAQPVIEETGERGTVATPGGETSVGTTPIGVGSVAPTADHRAAAAQIMGQPADDDAATAGSPSRLEQRSGSSPATVEVYEVADATAPPDSPSARP